MAVLADNERAQAAREFIRQAFERLGGRADFDTAQIRAAINAADDWADTNAVSFNNALPTAFKNNATAAQKALVLSYVCMKRAGLF